MELRYACGSRLSILRIQPGAAAQVAIKLLSESNGRENHFQYLIDFKSFTPRSMPSGLPRSCVRLLPG